MHGARGEENRPRNRSEEGAATLKAWWLIGPFRLFQTFSSCSVFAYVFWFFSFLCVFVSLSLSGSCSFFFPVLQMFYAEKWKRRPKGSPCLFMVSLSFLVFSAFSSPHSPLLLAFLISQQRKDEGKKLPLFSAFFFPLLTACLSCIFFLSFFFCFFFLLFLSFSPFTRSLEGLIYSLTYLYLGKIQCINSGMQILADLQ